MPVKPRVVLGTATAGNAVTLTEGAQIGDDVLICGTYEVRQAIDSPAFLPGTYTDPRGNSYLQDDNYAFSIGLGDFSEPAAGGSHIYDRDFARATIGDIGTIGIFCYCGRVATPLQVGDVMTMRQATNMAVLKTRGLVLSGAFPRMYGVSAGSGTLSDDSTPTRTWEIGYPFGTAGIPVAPEQRGDLLLAITGFRFPFGGEDAPGYTVDLGPGWTVHAQLTGERPGQLGADGLIVASMRIPSVGLYSWQGTIADDRRAMYLAAVQGYHATPGVEGGGPSSVHSQHGRYVVATEEGDRLRIYRAPGPVPPFEFDAFVGPVGASSPRLAWNPRRGVLQLLYAAPTGYTELITSNDSGKTWSDPVTIFTEEGSFRDHAVDQHGYSVYALFTEVNPSTGVGAIQIARQGIADSAPSLPDTITLAGGDPLFFEPVGFTLSPANDRLGRWLLSAVPEGETAMQQWISTDRCRTWKPVL